MDQNQERRRGHFHRGRRGPDRRGIERRTQTQQPHGGRDQVDVEHIMRDIRARIAQRQGIDLSNQQIQDLAARRLESILDPRAIKPSLLEGLRRSAGAATPAVAPKASSEPVYTFDHNTIYDSPRAALRFIRRLLNPLLKLFFNPNPLIRAMHLQAGLNVQAAEREAERDRRQAEWNALHYEILQRVVTDVSRVSLEVQALTMRVESLNARVDFNDRRVRSMEGGGQSRAAARATDVVAPPATESAATTQDSVEITSAEGTRRRRRRRRGRRGGQLPGESSGGSATPFASGQAPAAHKPLNDAPPEEFVAAGAELTPAPAESPNNEFVTDLQPREVAAVPEPPPLEQTVPSSMSAPNDSPSDAAPVETVEQRDADRPDQ